MSNQSHGTLPGSARMPITSCLICCLPNRMRPSPLEDPNQQASRHNGKQTQGTGRSLGWDPIGFCRSARGRLDWFFLDWEVSGMQSDGTFGSVAGIMKPWPEHRRPGSTLCPCHGWSLEPSIRPREECADPKIQRARPPEFWSQVWGMML